MARANTSIEAHLGETPNPPRDRGKNHRLIEIIILVVVALIGGANREEIRLLDRTVMLCNNKIGMPVVAPGLHHNYWLHRHTGSGVSQDNAAIVPLALMIVFKPTTKQDSLAGGTENGRKGVFAAARP